MWLECDDPACSSNQPRADEGQEPDVRADIVEDHGASEVLPEGGLHEGLGQPEHVADVGVARVEAEACSRAAQNHGVVIPNQALRRERESAGQPASPYADRTGS